MNEAQAPVGNGAIANWRFFALVYVTGLIAAMTALFFLPAAVGNFGLQYVVLIVAVCVAAYRAKKQHGSAFYAASKNRIALAYALTATAIQTVFSFVWMGLMAALGSTAVRGVINDPVLYFGQAFVAVIVFVGAFAMARVLLGFMVDKGAERRALFAGLRFNRDEAAQ